MGFLPSAQKPSQPLRCSKQDSNNSNNKWPIWAKTSSCSCQSIF